MQSENNNRKVLLEVRDVKQYFPVKKTKLREKQRYVRANDGITLDIYEGETLGLVGESGCGKSTLGRTILQLYPQTHGDIIYHKDGKEIDLKKQTPEQMRVLRKDLQLIFQDPYSSLNPRMTVGQIIGEGLVSHGIFKKNDPAMKEYIFQVMEECGLATYMFNRYPHQFSGGQRQRIGIARSLALRPKFVVCDEAVSALDVSIQSQILNLLSDLKAKAGLTYLFITHDLSVVKYISDRIAVMYTRYLRVAGRCRGAVQRHAASLHRGTALRHPTTEENNGGRERILLEGDIPSPVNPPEGCKFHTRCRYCQEKCKHEVPEWREISKNHYVACHFPLHENNAPTGEVVE